jgi:hypothetical protein
MRLVRLVAPHFRSFKLDRLAAASSHPISVPRIILASATAAQRPDSVLIAIPAIKRKNFERNRGARRVIAPVRCADYSYGRRQDRPKRLGGHRDD